MTVALVLTCAYISCFDVVAMEQFLNPCMFTWLSLSHFDNSSICLFSRQLKGSGV